MAMVESNSIVLTKQIDLFGANTMNVTVSTLSFVQDTYSNTSSPALDMTSPFTDLTSWSSTQFSADRRKVARRPMTIEDILAQYWEYTVARDLGLYGYPFIIVLGTLGNILTFLIMIKPSMRRTSTCFYMAVLAFFDTLVLYFACLRQWMALVHGTDALTLNSAACKSLNFFSYFSFDVAVWILVAMTIERFIAVHFPFRAPKMATVSRARKVVVLLITIFILANVHFFWTVSLDERGRCLYLEEFSDFHDDVWPWIDAVLYSFLPFLLLLTFNCLIIYDSRKALGFRRSTMRARRKKTRQKSSGFEKRLSAMLVTVSLAFLILSAPNVILISIRHKYFDFSLGVEDFRDVAIYRLVATITSFCLYLNHSMNFLLYCLSGQRFRRELWFLIHCRWNVHRTRTSTFSDALSTTRTQRLSESASTASPSPCSYRREHECHM